MCNNKEGQGIEDRTNLLHWKPNLSNLMSRTSEVRTNKDLFTLHEPFSGDYGCLVRRQALGCFSVRFVQTRVHIATRINK